LRDWGQYVCLLTLTVSFIKIYHFRCFWEAEYHCILSWHYIQWAGEEVGACRWWVLMKTPLVWKNSNCFLQPYQLLWNMLGFTFRSYFSLVRSPDQNIHPERLWNFGPHYLCLCWKTVPNTIPNLDGFNHGPSKERSSYRWYDSRWNWHWTMVQGA